MMMRLPTGGLVPLIGKLPIMLVQLQKGSKSSLGDKSLHHADTTSIQGNNTIQALLRPLVGRVSVAADSE